MGEGHLPKECDNVHVSPVLVRALTLTCLESRANLDTRSGCAASMMEKTKQVRDG